MTHRDPKPDAKPTIDDILRDVPEVPEEHQLDPPEFVLRAKEEALQRGVDPADILDKQALDALHNADYPGPDCLKPFELERARDLTGERREHCASCVPCGRLLRSAERIPPPPAIRPVAERPAPSGTLLPNMARHRWSVPVRLATPLLVVIASGLIVMNVSQRATETSASIASLAPPDTRAILVLTDVSTSVPLEPTCDSGCAASAVGRLLAEMRGSDVIQPASRTAHLVQESLDKQWTMTLLAADIKTIVKARAEREGQEGFRLLYNAVDIESGRTLREFNHVTTAARFNVDTARFATLLSKDLDAQWKGDLSRPSTVDLGDGVRYALYLRGRAALDSRTNQGLATAVGLFEAALRDNDGYALAHTGLADAYMFQALYGSGAGDRRSKLLDKAGGAVARALALAPNLAEAHTSRGLQQVFERDYRGAEESFKRAIASNPSYPLTRRFYANLLIARSQFADAQVHVDRYVALDPLSLSAHVWKSESWIYQGKPAETVTALSALLAEPSSPIGSDKALLWQAHLALARALESTGQQPERALREIEAARKLATTDDLQDGELIATMAYIYAKTGKRTRADELVDQLLAQPDVRHVLLAPVFGALGEFDRAIQSLNRAVEQRDADLLMLGVDPHYDALRADPRFQELLVKLGLQRQAPLRTDRPT